MPAQERALFVSANRAILAADCMSLKYGVDELLQATHNEVKPVYIRGCLKGYEAWYVAQDMRLRPVLEHEMEVMA